MTLKIAIVGAGPGGCMLARLLLESDSSINVTIFEAEASVNYRSQGGTLDLRSGTGLAAIKAAGLWDEFQKHARYDGESLLVTDKNLTTWMRRSPRKDGNDGKNHLQEAPEIDRKDLRRMLMESLPSDTVHWGSKLSHVEETSFGLNLHFANGQVHSGYDLIVGCDGAFSKTRSLLSSEKPFYVGLGGWALDIPSAATTAPDVYKLVNRGSVFVFSDHKALDLQQLSDGSIHVAYYGTHPEDFTRTCGFDAANLEEAKHTLRKELADWKPELLDAVEKVQGEAVWRNLYQLPVGFTWPHKSGITLLGDAAHLMTPFSGIGVNTAFHDAMLLSQEIVAFASSSESGTLTLDEHIKTYESKMFTAAHAGMRHTEGSMNDMLFTAGAPRTSIESWVLRHAKEEVPKWAHPLLTAIVYTGYWVYKRFV
ncbi:hypothetical protein BKA66DRAFT_207472 [Pyrenochaeta sp. MPI-SDFR-AT-0127]|nr:hypothetical protein BKA66DRAFT_207472 [Pyrenochaeta sp. MPI-SDFR-AT-0127]